MPSNLSADERAAVERVRSRMERTERILNTLESCDMVRHSLKENADLRTLLAVVARAGEPVDYGHLAHCNASRSAPIGPNRSCVCWNLMQDGIAHRTAAQTGEAVAWGIWHYNGDLVGLKRTKDEAERWCEGSATYGPPRPLYAHPADARDRGDAVRGVLLAFHDWPAHSSAFADGERRRALDTLAATMHAAPAAPEDK